mmetsp:Transcript_101610/g.294034  ORF Transcript_101610/g.294034 Transcript_101610/m.294034 type:complete len:427 (+) Transcript_101610:119-1399(+)
MAGNVPNFALTPADAIVGPIDWSTYLGGSIAKHAPKPLMEDKFGGETKDLTLFLRLFKMRGREFGWFNLDRAITVGDIRQDPTDPQNLDVWDYIDNYGTITSEEIRAHVEQYMFANNDDSRRAQQDDRLAFDCLRNSLAAGLMNKVLLKESDWTVANPADPSTKKTSAILFLRTIIEESSIQTNATTSAIRTRLSELDKYIVQIDSDISKFNEYVELNVAALTARGETTTDLLVNLWKAYKNCGDKTFASYMKREHEDYQMKNEDVEPRALMNTALNMFKLMKESGEWKKPTESDREIIALRAQIEDLKKKSRGQDRGGNGGRRDTRRPTNNRKPEAMKSAPQDVNMVVQYKGKPWYWCCKENGGKCGGRWRAHEPKQCKGLNYHKPKGKDKKAQPEKETPNKKLKMAKAVQALQGDENGSEGSDE